MRERVILKSPVREYCTPGSVRGAPGNRCPYLDKVEGHMNVNGRKLTIALPFCVFLEGGSQWK
jgi:hypothetical protein